MALAGTVVGLYLHVLSQVAVGTGETVGRRPQARAFGWPLRLIDRVNILIIGVDVTLDNRRRVLNVARADTLVLTSFDPDRRRIVAMSIPRDTRADLPGFGTTKINASYAYGGPGLAIKTVEGLLGVKVHYYVKLGPESFKHLVDAIGGVTVDVEKDMKYADTWAGFSIDLKKGRQRLNGDQATGYIRFRHDEMGDIGRVERQRKVMHGLLKEIKQPSMVLAAPRLLRAFAENTETNVTPVGLMTLGLFALRTDAPLQEYTLPGSFAPLYWEPDVPRIQKMIADLFYGVTVEELAETTIEVMNRSGVPGLGWRVASRIQALGFRSVKVRSAAPAAATVVYYRPGHRNVARMMLLTLTRGAIKQEPRAGRSDIVIVLARDAVRRTQSTMLRRVNPP